MDGWGRRPMYPFVLFYITMFVSLQEANLCKPLIGISVQHSGQAICIDKLFSDSANILTIYVIEQ
jgi:hypothetical protein